MLLLIDDLPNPNALLAVALLRRYFKRDVVFMSGDNRRIAMAVARFIDTNQVLYYVCIFSKFISTLTKCILCDHNI